MKSLRNGTSSRFRIAAAAVFAVTLLISGPAMALDSYNFGEVEVGSEANVALDVTNLSTVAELTFSISLELQGAGGFSLPSSTVTIPAAGTAQVQVNFSPNAVGACADTVQVFYKTYVMQEISLTGTGIEAAAAAPADLSPMAAAMQRWASAIASREYKGQTIGDRVQECFDSADNHGQAVRCVAKLASQLRKERRISRWDAWEMKDFAAKSRYHHKHKKHWMQKKADFRETREKHGRRWSNWD